MPHLKGEVIAARAAGFTDEESGSLNLWFPDSCSVRRQRVRAGSACRQKVAVGTVDPNPSVAFQRQLPFQVSLYDAPTPPLKGEVPAAQAVGFEPRRIREL